jgi:hypothetical protein
MNEQYFPITKVNVTWNNQSGLLGTARQVDLYYMSKKSGLKMNYQQFVGGCNGVAGSTLAPTVTYLTGGIVCLDFCDMIPIMEDYYSSGSIGTWSFSVQIDAVNNTASALNPATTGQLELLTVFQQSGCFQTTAGVSSQYIGVLSKDIVLRVSQEEPITKIDNERMVGGGLMSGLTKGLKAIATSPVTKSLLHAISPHIKDKLSHSANPLSGLAHKGIELAGYGKKPRVKGKGQVYA